jgi:hypothetical protein
LGTGGELVRVLSLRMLFLTALLGAIGAEQARKFRREPILFRFRGGYMRIGTAQKLLCALAIAVIGPRLSRGQPTPAFNGATGFGSTFQATASDPMPAGGWLSNATIYHVTTTQDLLDVNGKPVVGTLRGAFYDYTNPSQPKQHIGNQIVVFDVGGVFNLTNGSLDIKVANNIYIAGQTAPSPVIVYGDTTQITHSTYSSSSAFGNLNNNLILRYMTFRKGTAGGSDALTFAGGGDTATAANTATNMIVDHVSTSWSEDEDLSLDNANSNVTVQNSIIADSLTTSHAYGSLIRARTNSSVTYANNLYANNLSRNPRPGSYNGQTMNFDFRNNVIYNWGDRAGYTGGASEPDTENVNINYVGNYAIAGPSTPTGAKSTTAFTLDTSGDPLNVHVYQSNNAIDSDHGTNPGGVPNGTDTGWGMFSQWNGTTSSAFPDASKWTDPIGSAGNSGAPANTVATPSMATQTAANAYNQLITKDGHGYVGNWWWSRDPIDSRIVGNVTGNTNPPNGVAAASPNAAELSTLLATPTVSRAAGWDTDNDGMPDLWERSMGLNPNSAADATGDLTGTGYVNVQKYLDEIGAFPAPDVIKFTGASGGNYANITNWHVGSIDSGGVYWQPSQYDEAQINGGTVISNKVDQHAGVLKIAAGASDTATFNVSGGWLQVENQLIIGGTATSVATLSLSGGELTAATLSKGAGGAFTFTGGKLHAGTVAFDLVNQGGTIAPGNRANAVTIVNATPVALSSIGATRVMGNLTMQSGAIEIELASATSFDRLTVDGTLAAGGALNVSLVTPYSPAIGDSFDILDWTTLSGTFSTIQLPTLSGAAWDTSQLYTTGTLYVLPNRGDVNRDTHVDIADVSALMTALSDLPNYQGSLTTTQLAEIADLTGDNLVTNADVQGLIVFLANGGGSSSVAAVPEPSTALLALVASALAAVAFRRPG